MKPGAIVLNVARGGILDEQAVADALAVGPARRGRRRRLRGRAAGRLAPAGRPEHAADAAPRRLHRRGPDPRRPRRSRPRSSTSSTAAARGTRSTPRCSRPRPPGRSRPYLPARRDRSAGSSPSSRAAASRRSTSRSPASSPSSTARRSTAAVLRGLLETVTTERVNLVNADGARARRAASRSSSARRPTPGAFAAQLTLSSETPDGPVDGRRDRRRRRGPPDPPRRLPPRHGAGGRDAHHPPHGPPGHGRADRARSSARPTSTSARCSSPGPGRARAP